LTSTVEGGDSLFAVKVGAEIVRLAVMKNADHSFFLSSSNIRLMRSFKITKSIKQFVCASAKVEHFALFKFD